jgi:hypothetical protein
LLLLNIRLQGMPERPRPEQLDRLSLLVVAYLALFPDAKDTVEGIRKWWIPSSMAQPRLDELHVVLEDLVARSWLLKSRSPASLELYGLNKAYLNQIREALGGNSALR